MVKIWYYNSVAGSVVKRLRHRPFTAVTRVRFPSESLIGILAQLGEHLPYKQRVTGSSPVGPILLKVSIKYGEVAQLARASGSYPGG